MRSSVQEREANRTWRARSAVSLPFLSGAQEGGRTILRMANNTGFKFIFQQRTAKTVPQPQPPDTLHAPVRVLMRCASSPASGPNCATTFAVRNPQSGPSKPLY
jgi:hypothetical protein